MKLTNNRHNSLRHPLVLGIFFCLLALIIVGCDDSAKSQSGTPVVAPSPTLPAPTPNTSFPRSAVAGVPTVIYYYQAIKQHNYAKAAAYLDTDAKVASGQKLDENELKLLAEAQTSAMGTISNMDVTPSSSDGTQVLTTITRSSGNRYHSHLTLKKEGSSWKIVSIDRV